MLLFLVKKGPAAILSNYLEITFCRIYPSCIFIKAHNSSWHEHNTFYIGLVCIHISTDIAVGVWFPSKIVALVQVLVDCYPRMKTVSLDLITAVQTSALDKALICVGKMGC